MRFSWVGRVLGKLVSHADNIWPRSLSQIVELVDDRSVTKVQQERRLVQMSMQHFANLGWYSLDLGVA
jgi:hypothetical protein